MGESNIGYENEHRKKEGKKQIQKEVVGYD